MKGVNNINGWKDGYDFGYKMGYSTGLWIGGILAAAEVVLILLLMGALK